MTDAPLLGISLAREAGLLLAWDDASHVYLLDGAGDRRYESRAPDRIVSAAVSDDGSLDSSLPSFSDGSVATSFSNSASGMSGSVFLPSAPIAGAAAPSTVTGACFAGAFFAGAFLADFWAGALAGALAVAVFLVVDVAATVNLVALGDELEDT